MLLSLEGDDSDQEDNEDDADKQMGDTNNAAEKYVFIKRISRTF